MLEALSEAGLGEMRFRVLDPRRGRMELAHFARSESIPPVVPDSMGDDLEVEPEDVQLVFVPRQGLDV